MVLALAAPLSAVASLPALLTLTSLAAIIAAVRLIGAAERRVLDLYLEIERDRRETLGIDPVCEPASHLRRKGVDLVNRQARCPSGPPT
jgi:hypothetical protein